METPVTIYYDYQPAIGINATSQAFQCRNDYFKTWDDFHFFIEAEFNGNVVLIPLTDNNYNFLLKQGVFDDQPCL